jgi:oligopeptide transport system substrate-binding protein
MLNYKKVISLILVIIMCFSLVACTTPGQKENDTPVTTEKDPNSDTNEPVTSSESSKKILRYSALADVPTLDPQLMNSIPSATIGYHIFDGLMRNHVGEIKPGVAERYDMSEDGKIYTFYLRNDAIWSDGEPITAHDYVYALRRLVDPTTASDYAFLVTTLIKNAGKINGGEMPVEELGVTAIDDKTLEIELVNAAGYFLSMTSMSQLCPVREDIVEKFSKEFASDAEKNVYSGPFIVKDWKHEDRIILEKNPNYWDKDAIKLDEVHVIVVPDAMTAVAMFEQGDLDQVNVPAEIIANYQDKVEYYFDGANDFLKLNMDGSNNLKSKDLRLAINYALNREDYILLTTNNVYLPNTRYVLPQVKGVDKDYGDEYAYEAFPVKGDAVKAKKHLELAMKELGISNASDITVELLTTDSERTRTEAEVLQGQIEGALGIKVAIKQVPYKQRLQMESDHDFEMVVTGWVPDYSDPMSYLELWPTGSPYNHGSYSSEEYDAYINEAMTNTDPKERMDALFNAEKTLLEDGAIVPLQLRRMAMLLNPKIKGFETYFVGINYDYIYADIEQ